MKSIISTISILFFCNLSVLGINAKIVALRPLGCDGLGAILKANVYNTVGTFTYQWSTGSVDSVINVFNTGNYSLTVYSGNDSVVRNYNLTMFQLYSTEVKNYCDSTKGRITIQTYNSIHPIEYKWYLNGMLTNYIGFSQINLDTGEYKIIANDATGCIDSITVNIKKSNPHLQMYIEDSSLCWNQMTKIWFNPGISLFTPWGFTINSTLDTFIFTNDNIPEFIPNNGADTNGCLTNSIVPIPFEYLQPFPDPPFLFNFGDTISTTKPVIAVQDTSNFYIWSFNGLDFDTTQYNFTTHPGIGLFSVVVVNRFGCITENQLNTTLNDFALKENNFIFPNPCKSSEYFTFNNSDVKNSIEIYNLNGMKIEPEILKTNQNKMKVKSPDTPGVYFLKWGDKKQKLLVE